MQDIEWEDVVVNDNSLDDIEWEDAKPVTQSVLDDRDGKIYNVPLAMDGIDTRYAIDTQHKGADKGSFFGKLNLDVDNVVELKAKALDYIHEKTKSALRGVVGIAGDVADTIVTEVSGLRDAQYKAEKGYSRYPSFFFGSDENQEEVKAKAQETVAKLENIKKRNQEWWNNAKQAIKKEEEMDEVDKFVEALSGGAVSVAASATSTLALRSPKVAAGVMATLFGKMRENELIDEALEQGVDIEKAEMIGAGGGLIEAGLEFAGDLFISKFAKLKPIMDAKDRILSSAIVKATKDKIGKAAVKKIATSHADSVIGAFAKGFGSEAFEEASQTGLGMGYENLVGLSNYSADEIYSNTLASAIIGGITGGTAGGVGTAYNNRIIRQTNERIKKLLKEDAPSLNDQELQVMADGVQEMLFQESTVYIDELNKVLDKEVAPDVIKEGLTPEQLTAETRKLLKEKYKMTDEQIDQTIKSSLSVIDARSQFNEAYTIFNEGLSNAGRDAARADAEARILAVRALAVARAEGTQVKDVLDRWNLQFRQTAWNEADIDGGANFQFAGPGAKNAALDKLDMAKQFEAKGLDVEDIRKQTGWFKGPDNKWRFEISDKDAKVTLIDFYKNIFNKELEEQENIAKRFPDYKPAQERLAELKSVASEVNDKNIYKLLQRDGHVYNFRLDQILQHDKLFEAYPEFRDVYVRFIVGDKNSGGYTETSSNSIGENWKASDTTINVNIASTKFKYPQLRKVLMHEIQHIIQTKEGFARGGSQSEYKTYLADIKSEYRQKIVKLFTDVVSEGLGVKVPYYQAIKLMEDVLEGNSENKGYIYKENNIERSDLKKLIDSRIEELVKKEGEIRDDMYKKIPKSEFEYYGRLLGEIEARNTERRINFSDKKRLETPVEETQDIKNADAIILFDDGTKVSYSNKNKMYYQEGVKQPSGHVVKPYTDRNNPSRLLHRQDENMLPEEKKAWDDYFASRSDADRIKANLEKYKGTPWERLAREQVFVHQAVNMILEGKTPDFESALDTVSYGKSITSDINSIAAILRGRVLSGGSGLKTVHSVNSSFLNCNPTPGCAKYCYAASSLLARNKNWLKPVLIDVLAENKPDLLAEMIVDQFKVSPLGQAGNKAIRLFDEGDGAPHWMNVIKEINKLGYRVAIFTKRKEFAWEVINHDNKKYGEAFNLVMFSSDASNFSEVEGDKKIPVAFVYSDESEIPMIKKMADNGQVRVILPIKLKGGKGIANETLQALFEEVPEVKPHVCPIDAGFKKIDPKVYVNEGDVKLTDKTSKGWNCAFCDRKGGVGCYHGFSTEKMNKLISKAKELKKSEEADIISQFQNLFTIIETLKQGDFVNDRQYREAGFVVRQDQQGNDRVLQDVTTSETGGRGDLGWLVSILNKRLTDVSGAVRRVSEANMSDSSGGSVGSGYQTSNGNGGYDTGVRDDGRGRSGSSARQSGLGKLFQRAFHGSPHPELEGGKFSLKKIGSGEGYAAHGWGAVYAAQDFITADRRYRERLVSPYNKFISFGEIKYNKETGKYENAFDSKSIEFEVYQDFKLNAEEDFDVLIKSYEQMKGIVEDIEDRIKIANKYKDYFTSGDFHYFMDENLNRGQVYELDVPENPYLIDEQKSYSEQSDFVKAALQSVQTELQKGKRKEKIFDNRDEAIDFYDSKIDEFNEKANGYQRFYPEAFTNEDGKFGVRYADDYTVYQPIIGENTDVTGGGIYKKIATQLGSQQAASELLEKYGIKGITYEGREDGRCFVIFNPDDVKVIEKFYQDQTNPNGPRGAYQNSIIYLFENADASTIIHELGHFFLDDMQKFADNETTKRQLEAIYKFVGSTDGNLTTEQHEYFANAFELYLMEGRAPNKVLEGVFVRFRKWLSRMWAEIKRISGVKLTPEIRKVFDEMLGGRGLDFAMQMSGAKMAEALESGTIPANVIAKAVQLLEDGKMSRADMDDLIARMKLGELKRSDFNQELKKFENSNTKHNERLNPFDKVKYREALARGNFSKKDVLEKINRLLKWTEPRSQNGKVVGRFSNLKMNQEFDHIRELMNMDKAQAKEKLNENIKLINAMIRGEVAIKEKDRSPDDQVGEMERLVFDNKILTIRLNKANASLLLDVYNAISDSYNMGRLTTAVTGEARRARKNRLVNEAVHVLTADNTVDWRRERGKFEQFVNQLGTSQMSWQGILDILSMNDKTSKTGRSLLVQNLDVFDAQQKEAQGLAEDGEKASRFMEKKLKGVGNAAISVSRYVNSKLDEKFTIQWGLNKKTFTKDQLLDIYMKAKDEETRKMMLEDPVLQYNERFLSEVNEILTAEDRAIAEALFEFYDDNYAKINAFYEEKYGTSLGKRAFYSPRSMDRGGINVDSGDLSSYAGFSGVKERKAKAGAVKIKGAFQVLQDYIVNSNHWIAWSDKLIDINAVMGDVEVKNIIRNLFGEGMEKRIAYEVSRMASNDKFQSKFGYGKLFNKIRSNYAIAALAAKPSLMIKQLTSFPAYWEHMSTAEFMSGLADFAIHMKEAVETLGNTTLMKTRDVNIIKDFEELSRSELFKKNANKVKLRELLMANIKLGDRGAIYMGGWALYKAELKKNLAKGMSEEKAKALALEKFERVTDETQQSGRLSQQSYWQSNPFLRAFTMFQSSQNQYLRKEINAIRGLATGRMDKMKAAKTLFIFHVLLPCFFQYASDGFDWDEKAQLRAALLGSLNGIFILNGILERGLDYALGTADAWKATSTALSDVLPFWGSGEDLAKFFIDLAEGDIDLEDYVEAIRAFGKPVGELTGVPVKYPLDVIQNFGSYAEEGEVKKEVLLWLGWSPYALRDKEED